MYRIDIQSNGFINELFNIGDVIITFDRPTHQEAFIFENIRDPIGVGKLLDDVFMARGSEKTTQLWYKNRGQKSVFRFIEDIFPEQVAR